MLISEASKQTGLSTKIIRFYCDRDLITPRRDPFTGYRSFTESDLAKLRFLKKARQLDFAIKDCAELLTLYDQPDRSSLDVKIIHEGTERAGCESRRTQFSPKSTETAC